MKVAQICMLASEVIEAEAEIIPGPPLSHENGLLVNVKTTWKYTDYPSDELLSRCRLLCFNLLKSLSENKMLSAPVTAISLVTSEDEAPIRVYSVTLMSSVVASVNTAIDLRKLSSNEFSMLDDLANLIAIGE